MVIESTPISAMKSKIMKNGAWLLLAAWIPTGVFAQDANTEADYTRPVAEVVPLDMKRVSEIATMLPEKPAGLGAPYKDRQSWDALKRTGEYDKVLKQAAVMAGKEFPAWDDARYMRMFTHGDSQAGKDLLGERLKWLITLTWAECLENKGTYIPKLEKVITDLLYQKTWVYPRNYNEKTYGGLVELSTASYAHNFAQARYLLDDKLSPALRKEILDVLHKRAFQPLMSTVEGKNRSHGWITSTNNWNAVCLSGVTGAALAAIPDKTERAKYVAIAERYTKNFVAGFLDDGYCTEGLGYYNYGFGRYITLRENVLQATNGRLDFFNSPKIRKIAGFLPNMEIINGTYPAIADCKEGSRPGANIMYYVSRIFQLGLPAYDTISLAGASNDLVADVLYVFPNAASKTGVTKVGSQEFSGLRSYFDAAGILTVRPARGSVATLGAVLKGGKNNEHHNHNDIGSYTIAVGDKVLMGDPGSIPYTAKTFGPERYTYKTIASYGHPVPLVAGQQQIPGAKASARIIRADFSETVDRFDMDITSGYEVQALKNLTRKFTYDRTGKGVLHVEDVFSYATPQPFETAVITRAQWQKLPSGQILLEENKQKLLLDIVSPDSPFEIKTEQISEVNSPAYTRIAIVLGNPLAAGTVKLTYKPID